MGARLIDRLTFTFGGPAQDSLYPDTATYLIDSVRLIGISVDQLMDVKH